MKKTMIFAIICTCSILLLFLAPEFITSFIMKSSSDNNESTFVPTPPTIVADALGPKEPVVITTKIPVLMYHHLDEQIQTGTIIHPDQFRKHMEALKAQGYTTITTADLLDIQQGLQKAPEKPIMITFDDGYKSNYQYLFPILKDFNMKATIYVITDFIENPDKHPSPYPKLTWDEIKEMSDSGLVAIESHTDDSHAAYGENGKVKGPITIRGQLETMQQYESRLYTDLIKSKRLIEQHTNKPVVSFSYPKGLYSSEAEKIVKKAGFQISVTTETGILDVEKNGLFLIPRVNIHGQATTEALLQTVEEMYAM